MVNLIRMQRSAARNIQRWGGSGFLVRAGAKRSCICARSEYKPMERGLYMDGSERFFIAGAGLTIPPDAELDLLQFKGNGSKTSEYRIILPPTGPRPDGIVTYYDCNVMKVREF